jgi:hypothetical protein
MDQVGRRRITGRTRWRAVSGVICVVWLGLAGVVAGCGGDGDGGDTEASDSAARAVDESDEPETTTSSSTTTTAPTTTTTAAPRVVYEIDGAGTVAVNYSIAGDRQQSAEVTLPWSEEQAEEPSRMSMLVALVGSQSDVTCRIRRGPEVLAEATLSGTAGPLLSCDYPPSGLPPVTFPPPPPPPPAL